MDYSVESWLMTDISSYIIGTLKINILSRVTEFLLSLTEKKPWALASNQQYM